MDYDDEYQNSQDCSSNFQLYLNEMANLIQNRMSGQYKVVEIGCGKGFFLEILEGRGFDIKGFDPAYEGNNPNIIKAYFNSETARSNIDVDAIIMRHAFEHIESPYAFLRQLQTILKNDVRIFIEVPSFEWIVTNKAFWDIFHEHCNYFSEAFFQGIFSGRAEIIRTFDSQYILVCASLSDLVKNPGGKIYSNYINIFSNEIARLRKLLRKFKNNYVWGAGAKGIAFANILDQNHSHINALIDINPKKQNYFISLSAHPCISPSMVNWSAMGKCDCLWIMNARYQDEILRGLPKLNCEVISLGSHDL